MPSRPTRVRLTLLVLTLLVVGCSGDHGPAVPASATESLECDGPVYRDGKGNPGDGLEESGDSPEEGLDGWLDPEAWFNQVPTEGYRNAAQHDGRALLSFEADGRTVIAFVMSDDVRDYRDEEGWAVDTYAWCDPAEWPAATTDALNIGVWTDPSGARVPVDRIRSFAGPEHCDWQETTFLFLGRDGHDGEFLGTPDRELRRYLLTTYAASVPLPPDATDTGYSRDGRRLWLAADGSAAYLVGADGTAQRWPATKRPIRCD